MENEKYIKSTRYEKFKGDLGPSDKYKKLRTCVSMVCFYKVSFLFDIRYHFFGVLLAYIIDLCF